VGKTTTFPVVVSLTDIPVKNKDLPHCSENHHLKRHFSLLAALTFIFSFQGQAAFAEQPLATQASRLLEQRCMVCHGCYDAPCQLKLEANQGLMRGAHKEKVYDGTRLFTAQTTRLFDDGFTEQQWRDKGFYPVIDKDQPDQGVMHRMLELKQQNPLPEDSSIYADFDFSLNREQQCPKPEEFDRFAKDYPLWGMPYGLPGLNPQEHQLMVDWLAQGAPAPALPPLSGELTAQISQWEAFLNGSSNKEKLMSRYLYEHLYLAGLYLEENDNPVWFRMVRSYTRPGRNIGLISTRRPFDDPRTGEFYYRLQRMPISILDKRHMPYRFDQARMDWYQELFLKPDYEIAKLPDFSSETISNPFRRFQAIPVKSRYEFLLHEAQFSIMNFIKGPVCRGQIALNVIDDHFWVMFVAPDEEEPEQNAEFLAREADNLRLPVAKTGTPIDLFRWRKYAKAEQGYAKAKARFLNQELDKAARNLDINDIWDGDGHNENAALTVFRHFDTASVVKGLVGNVPKTAWVISYPLLERIHYLLVAGFDVYGGASHQLESRLYMDFLRMEGEYNFLMFLPPEDRIRERNDWYREASSSVTEHYFANSKAFQRDTDIEYKTDNPKAELLLALRERIHGADAPSYDYHQSASKDMITAFERLENSIGRHNSYIPEVSFLNVIGNSRDEVYTILRNSAHLNIAQPFGEQDRRLPEEDKLTVVRGFIGAYPNNFFQVNEKDLPKFVEALLKLDGRASQDQILQQYGAHRYAKWFWRLSDKLQGKYNEEYGLEAGIFDLNRYHHR
jgi:fatty acid cis/trans isomerase CTI